ncbi:MAG: glycosyltransferase family 1 protein [Candidatus Thorarchaeota archaeon]|nr:glycosyltransferase family 1 protein [Candidatus Thorarchaeota archaeon]
MIDLSISICFVSGLLPPISVGGVERYVLNLVEELPNTKYKSLIISHHYRGLGKLERKHNCRIYRVGWNPLPYSQVRIIGSISRELSNLTSLLDNVKNHWSFDIVHSQFGEFSDVVYGTKICRENEAKHVVTIHGRFGTQFEDIRMNSRRLDVLRKADYLITNRQQTFQYLLKMGFEKLALLRNPIPVSKYKRPDQETPPRERKNIELLFLGRLSLRKGPFLAIQGFAYAAKKDPNLNLCMVGGGVLEKQLRAFAEKMDLKDRVHFTGPRLDIRPFLWKSDVFLATSPTANSPSLSLREAMAAGIPVIATDVEETGTVVRDGKTGLLVKPNPRALGEAILKLTGDENMMKRYRMAAAKQAEIEFDLNGYVSALDRIYDAIME